MNRIRYFNEIEIEELLHNSNIIGIKNRSQLIYKNEFKLWAVLEKVKHSEKTAREIFESAGFNMNILNEQTPQRRLSSWIKKYKVFGVEYFIPNNQYRYKSKILNSKISVPNETEEIKSLIDTLEKNNLLTSKLTLVIEKLLNKL